jgi:hypothetical protein
VGAVCWINCELVCSGKMGWEFRDDWGVRCVAGGGLGLLHGQVLVLGGRDKNGQRDEGDASMMEWGRRERGARR